MKKHLDTNPEDKKEAEGRRITKKSLDILRDANPKFLELVLEQLSIL